MEQKEKNKIGFSSGKIVWIVGGIVLLAACIFGFKAVTGSFESYKATLINVPKEIPVGSLATFTWRVDGPATTINNTAVYFGTVSNPGDLDTDITPRETNYTDFVKDFTSGDYNIPLQFVGNTSVKNQGKYYFRVYAQVEDKHYWSDEYSFTVRPAENKVSLINAPEKMTVESISTFTWRVEGPSTTISSTAIYFGTTSTPRELGKDVKPEDTEYLYVLPDFVKGRYNIPLQFVGNLKIATAGAYFYRVHANIEGRNYWTDEMTLDAE